MNDFTYASDLDRDRRVDVGVSGTADHGAGSARHRLPRVSPLVDLAGAIQDE